MNRDIFDRLRREAAITMAGTRETLLAIADRVNRKTQALKFHWHAAEATRQLGLYYEKIGVLVSDEVTDAEQRAAQHPDRAVSLQRKLEEFYAGLQSYKQELARIDRRIAEIEAEALNDDLHRLQLDLGARSLTIERLTVAQEAAVVGQPPAHLVLAPGVKVMIVFRGPALLSDHAHEDLRAGDVVFLLGSRADLQKHRAQFHLPARATA